MTKTTKTPATQTPVGASKSTAEAALEEQNFLLNALINSAHDLVIFSLDRNYRYTAFNRKHRQEMQRVWQADISLGASLLDCMTDPGLRDLARQSVDRALAGESYVDIQHQPELDIYYEFHWSPIRQRDGSINGVSVFIGDISARIKADARVQRATQLYAVLSQCNQSIVRCTGEAQLFPQICRDAVTFGGMKMAWVGLIDQASQQIKPVAAFGAGKDYLDGLDITTNANEPRGRGPTGTASRENRPVWCQDFLNDPSTAPWHERGARVGWGSSASLPLHRFGLTIGAITLYAAEVNAFDEEARKLLQALALDISFALDSYARETARSSAEEALRKSEALSIAILDSVSAEVAVLDRDGTIVAVNEPWRRFALENASETGRAAPDSDVGGSYLAACRTSGFVAAAEAGKAGEGIQAVLDGKSTSFTMEYACHSPTVQRWFSMSVTPLGPAGRGAVVAHTNITERRRVEEALHQSTQRFRDLVDTTDGIVWEADAVTFDFTFVSANAERMLGHPVADWLIPGFWASHIYPEDREQAIAHCATCTQRLEDHEFEYRFIAQSGQVIWVADIVKVVEENGKPRWLRGLMIDISQRKRAEVDLRALSRAIEQSPASIVITDRAGVIEYVNPHFEQVTGYTRAEVIGVNPRVLQSGKTPAQVYQQLWAAITVGGEWRGELCNRRKNGELFWEFAAISGVRGENGEIEHYIAVKADITERKRAQAAHEELEAQLRQSQKMEAIGTLAGGIAHDFNNIIATILGNAELARRDLDTQPLALECLDEIRKAGARARDLVQQILSFSRRQATERKRTALTPVVEESARLLRATLSTRVSLKVHCARDVPPVFADATQMEQVIINLVTNAMHAMRDGPGRIDIRLDVVTLDAALAVDHPELGAMYTRQPGRTVRLRVSDDGAGMEAATLSRIFEPFFTTKPVGEGTGLGLSVVHGIVQAHEGAISVESQPGGGSTFTLYLPPAGALSGEPETDEIVAATGRTAEPDDAHHILYIDDDESLVFLIKRMLERRGFRISTYTDQHEGLAALRADPAIFDLVVTDYNMPGMSGLDVAREVRAIRADLPVAVASGFIDEALHAQAGAAGVQELIFKASAVEDLGEAFARLAQRVAPKSAPRN